MDLYKGRPENPTPEGGGSAPKEKAAGLDAEILMDKFADKKHTGTGSDTDPNAPSYQKDLDIGKRFIPEGGMGSSEVDATGHQTSGE